MHIYACLLPTQNVAPSSNQQLTIYSHVNGPKYTHVQVYTYTYIHTIRTSWPQQKISKASSSRTYSLQVFDHFQRRPTSAEHEITRAIFVAGDNTAVFPSGS